MSKRKSRKKSQIVSLIKKISKEKEKKKNKVVRNDLFTGKVEGHSDGYAFFISEDKKIDDVFIHPKNLNGAIHNDTVTVKLGTFKGRKEATVVKILKRGISTFVGIADITRRRFDVIPFSKNFVTPMRVIKSDIKCYDCDIIVCKIKRYPNDRVLGEVEIVERLGHIEDKGVDNKIVMYKYGYTKDYPKEVIKQAKEINEGKFNKNTKNVADFRHLFTVTIDGDTARDFDDAISIEECNGITSLYVHIADVSRFVTKNSPIDIEAKKRGTSVYFVEFAIAMLPEVLSNNLCSLVPNEDRFTVTAKIDFDKKANIVNSTFYRSIINSNHRLTYSYVNKVLNNEEKPLNDDLKILIKKANKLSLLIEEKRNKNGSIDFDLPEAEFTIQDGIVVDIYENIRGQAEKIIENFMITANEVVATEIFNKKIPSLYRTHGEPDVKKVEAWLDTAYSFGVFTDNIKYPIDNKTIKELSNKASKSKYSFILNQQLVRCMMRAEYSIENTGHFGLASKAYTHFTSPIRRYPDLVVHRILLNELNFSDLKDTYDELYTLSPTMSKLERQADDSEYEISQFKKIEYLKNHYDDKFEAYITKITANGFFVYVEKLLMSGFVDFSVIDYDIFSASDDFLSIKGRKTKKSFILGDKVKVSLYRVSIILLRVDFKLCIDKKKVSK